MHSQLFACSKPHTSHPQDRTGCISEENREHRRLISSMSEHRYCIAKRARLPAAVNLLIACLWERFLGRSSFIRSSIQDVHRVMYRRCASAGYQSLRGVPIKPRTNLVFDIRKSVTYDGVSACTLCSGLAIQPKGVGCHKQDKIPIVFHSGASQSTLQR